MVVRIKSIYTTLAAGSSETKIGEITVNVGRQYNVLEILPIVPTNSWLYIYIENDRVAEIQGDVIAKDNSRIVVNWSLTGGQKLIVSGTNGTGSSQIVGCIIVYDDVKAA
jgi:hypothetical protein